MRASRLKPIKVELGTVLERQSGVQQNSSVLAMELHNNAYEYSVLHEDQIRLVYLLPGLYHEDLVAVLEHTCLKQSPMYEALSYTWGTSVKGCHMSLKTETGYGRLAITSNLKAALLRMRSIEHTKAIWIDQVCINQDDILERSLQVPRMGVIYSSAYQVSIWIGEEDDDSRKGLSFLQIILSYLPPSEPTSNIKDDSEYVLPMSALPIARSEGWEALKRIFDRPWFRRVWVVQETAMAAQARVICGSFAVSWEDLARACRVQIRQESLRHGHNALESIDNTRRKRIEGRRDLYDILFMSYMFDCTDPRDKIYAMTGLADPLPKACMTFDYIRSTEEIYLRFAVELMLSDNTLDLLHCVVSHTMLNHLPSWVPDWRSEPFVMRMLKEQNPKADCYDSDDSSQFCFSKDRLALTVTGKSIGSISAIGMTMSYTDRHKAISQWQDIAESTSERGSETYPRNFLQTLVAATETHDHIASLYAAWANVLNRSNSASGYRVPGSLDDENQMASVFDGIMTETCMGRRAIVLNDCVIGLAPTESRVGDLVCCFENTKYPLIPFVIRCQGNSYHLIGQSFIAALSNSQPSSLPRLSDLPRQQFILV